MLNKSNMDGTAPPDYVKARKKFLILQIMHCLCTIRSIFPLLLIPSTTNCIALESYFATILINKISQVNHFKQSAQTSNVREWTSTSIFFEQGRIRKVQNTIIKLNGIDHNAQLKTSQHKPNPSKPLQDNNFITLLHHLED